ALETLPRLEDRAPFDLVFIDADKTGYPEYLTWAHRLARPGTLIVADNVVRSGKVASPEDEAASAVRRYLEQAGTTPGLTGTAIQTVGSKGYDGFSLTLVTSLP
ncbi:MAG: O-methyltransferase, partial [Streptosporangiaceae bacterium]